MAKSYTGIDIGTGHIKMAVVGAKGIAQLAVEEVPENLVKDGRIISLEAMSDLIRKSAKSNHISVKDCGFLLHDKETFTRRLTIPAMTVEELELNLPYEFRDFIADDKEKYNYDYAVLNTVRDPDGTPVEMNVLAAATPTSTVNSYAEMLKRAGFRLKIIAPDMVAFGNLIRVHDHDDPEHIQRDYCFIDIGFSGTKMHLFPGGNYEVTRSIEFGTSRLAAAVADAFSVDKRIASTYLVDNYENAQRIPACLDLYEQLGLEVARVISFFNFNYPESQLDTILYCGTGSSITPLLDVLAAHLTVQLQSIEKIMPPSLAQSDKIRECPSAVGIVLV